MATSQRVILFFLGIVFINSFLGEGFQESLNFANQIQVTLLASFVAWLYFTLFGYAIRLFFKTFSISRIVFVSLLYASTEVVRFQILLMFIDTNALVGNLGIPFIISGSISTGLLLLATLSIVFHDFSNYRTAYADRVNQLDLLEASLSKVEETVKNTQAQFVSEVRKTLQTELNSALRRSSRDNIPASVLADELFRVSDEVVRPLSAAFASRPPILPEAQNIKISARPSLRELIRLVTTASPFRPVELTLVSALLSLSSIFAYRSIAYLAFWIVFLVSVFALNWLAMRFITPHLGSWNVLIRIFFITVITAIPFTVYVGFVFLPTAEFLGQTQVILLYLFFISAVVGWLVAVSQGIAQGREQILSQLSSLGEQLRWANVRAQCLLWLDQRKLALVLHNQVQGNLLASAMKLRQSIKSGNNAMEDTITEVRDRILEPLDLDSDGREKKSLSKAVKEINNTWKPLITLKVECDPTLARQIVRDKVCFDIVTEIMTEFQTNSLKYGSASHTTVNITQTQDRILSIRLTNNGKKLAHHSSSLGLGTQFFDSIALLHKTEDLDHGVQVYVEIPFLPEDKISRKN